MIKSLIVTYHDKKDLINLRNQAGLPPAENLFLQIFSGILDKGIINDLIGELTELFPGAAIIGTSTAGEIIDNQAMEEQIVVSLTIFEHSTVSSTFVDQNDDLEALGKSIATALNGEKVKTVIILGSGLKDKRTINGEPLLSAVKEGLGSDVVIAGGQAGDNGFGETTFVFTQDGITEHGAVAAAISGDKLEVQKTYNLSWVPIGKKFTITKAEGPRVYSIDNQSPYELYSHYLGQEIADGLPLAAADFPMIIERNGITMAIHATGVNDDGSFEYIHNFHAGEQMRFGFCHAGLLGLGAENIFNEVRTFKPQALFIYSCVSRKWVLGADISVELSSVTDLAPCAGFFCYGEYFTLDTGKPVFFSQTMTILSLAEIGDKKADKAPPKAAFSHMAQESRHFRTMRVLHRLVETSTNEIESINEELASLARKDSLTSLGNRRRFDEEFHKEMNRHKRSCSPLSLILLDIDFFKQYNDLYGHVAGDDCLRGVAQVLKKTLQRQQDLAFRYGGEEFSCLLPDTDLEGAEKVAEEIRLRVEGLKIPHDGSKAHRYLTVSIGVATVDGASSMTEREIFKQCDNLLYRAKQFGRNRVVCRQ